MTERDQDWYAAYRGWSSLNQTTLRILVNTKNKSQAISYLQGTCPSLHLYWNVQDKRNRQIETRQLFWVEESHLRLTLYVSEGFCGSWCVTRSAALAHLSKSLHVITMNLTSKWRFLFTDDRRLSIICFWLNVIFDMINLPSDDVQVSKAGQRKTRSAMEKKRHIQLRQETTSKFDTSSRSQVLSSSWVIVMFVRSQMILFRRMVDTGISHTGVRYSSSIFFRVQSSRSEVTSRRLSNL